MGRATVRVVTASSDEPAALVQFQRTWAVQFGPPNDEAFHGHPLYERGLHPYAAAENHRRDDLFPAARPH
jgi:hypothetical protein